MPSQTQQPGPLHGIPTSQAFQSSPAEKLPQTSRQITWSFDSLRCKYEAEWRNPPEVSNVRAVLEPFLDKLGLGHDPDIKFLSEGSFNRVFHVSQSQRQGSLETTAVATRSFVLRVALPVLPYYKTASEVATMVYVRQHSPSPESTRMTQARTTNLATHGS